MMISDIVYVFVKQSGVGLDPVLAGRLEFFEGHVDFKYSKQWLSHKSGFAFHPEFLPLDSRVYSSHALDGCLSVFRDSGPGAWGREILKRHHGQVGLADMLVMSNNLLRIGVFGFSASRDFSLDANLANFASEVDINEIYESVKAFEMGSALSDRQMDLLNPGSSMDGMQPKAFVSVNGVPCILKFPSKNDYDNKAICEFIGMNLSAACGIETAKAKMINLGDCKQGLAVQRFDVFKNDSYPLMSIGSAMGFSEGESFKRDYRYASETLARISKFPAQDREQLFKRMALNVMISNRDDHIFNQALIRKNGDWVLSPAYDVVCGEGNRRQHAMVIGEFGANGTLTNVLSSCKSFGISEEKGKNIIDDMVDLISARWRPIAVDAGIPVDATKKIEWAILHPDIFRGYGRRIAPEPSSFVVSGQYEGTVVSANNGLVFQKINREGECVSHNVGNLTRLLREGEVASIQYKNGIGVVKERALENGLSR